MAVVAVRGKHGRTREPRLAVAATLVAGIPFLIHAWVALHGYFGQDDFVITYRAAHADPLDFGYLFQDYSGHLAPGTFLLAWLETAIAPLNHAVATVPLLAMHALSLWLFWRVLVRAFGESWRLVPGFAVFAASPLVLFPTLWWAYGMQLLPLLVTMCAALLAHLRYLDTGRGAYHSLLWTVVGMLCYEKAALFAPLLFGITALRTTAMTALMAHRRLWGAHALLLIGYAIVYFGLTESQSGDAVSAGQLAEYVYRSIVDTFIPGLLGGPLAAPGGGATWVTPPLVIRIVTVAVAVAFIVWRRSLAWVLLAGYLAVDLALVAVTRLSLVGPVIGADPRYLADAVPVAVLCGMFAMRGARLPARPVAVATVLVIVGSLASFLRLAPALQFQDARDYVANARAALARQPDMVLYDTAVPRPIILDWFVGDAVTSRVVGLVPERPKFDEPAETLYQLDGNGRPQPILRLTDTVAGEPGPVPDCGHAVDGGPARIPLTSPSFGRRVLKLGYYTSGPGDGTITVGDARVPVRFESGLHVLHVVVSGSYTHVEVSRAANLAPLCVTDVTIGLPA